jgi:hypothetical protein
MVLQVHIIEQVTQGHPRKMSYTQGMLWFEYEMSPIGSCPQLVALLLEFLETLEDGVYLEEKVTRACLWGYILPLCLPVSISVLLVCHEVTGLCQMLLLPHYRPRINKAKD